MRQTTTIKDVASLADVSVGTVSRVLAGNATVKQPLRERVEAAVTALGYKPNLAARALRTNRVDVVGLVVPDITNPFFAQLAKAVESIAATRNLTVMLANTHGDLAHERVQIAALLDRSPAGLFVVGVSDESDVPIDTRVPIVALDRHFGCCPHVGTDHERSAALLARHLFVLGHRRIACLSGPSSTRAGRLRRAGVENTLTTLSTAAMRRNPADESLQLTVVEGLFDYASGESLARELLARAPKRRPTAILAASDQQAIGALRAARDIGLRVPEDVSVAGFDDIALAELVVPRLTTLRQPVEQLADTAFDVLFAGHPGSADGSKRDRIFVGDLVIRESTRARAPRR